MRFLLLFALLVMYSGNATAQSLDWLFHPDPAGAGYESANDIVVDAAGNSYTIGYFEGTVDFDPGSGTHNITSNNSYRFDCFVQKLDPNGNLLWVITFGGTGDDEANGIAIDNAGNIYVTGHFLGTVDFDPGSGTFNLSSSSENGFLLKLDSNGNFIWAAHIGTSGLDLFCQDVAITPTNKVAVTGKFYGTHDVDPGAGTVQLVTNGGSDAFLLQLDTAGTLQWATSWGGLSHDDGSGVAGDSQGNVYCVGGWRDSCDFDAGAGVYNQTVTYGFHGSFCQKFDNNGNWQWVQTLDGTWTGSSADEAIGVGPNDEVYIAGNQTDTLYVDTIGGIPTVSSDNHRFLSKLNPTNGNELWQQGAENRAADIFVAPDGIIYLAAGYPVSVLAHYPDGTEKWVVEFPGPSDNIMHSVAVDAAGNVFGAASYYQYIDLDPGPGLIYQNASNLDMFAVKITPPVCDGQGCIAPENTFTLNLQDTSAILRWDTVCGAAKYKIMYKVAGPGPWTVIYKYANVGSYTLTGLAPNTTYRWRIQTDCSPWASGNGWSSPSAPLQFTTLGSPCYNPTGLNTQFAQASQAKVVWTAAPQAWKYKVRYRVQGTSSWTIINKDPVWQHHWLTGLAAGTTYEWGMRTVCAPGQLGTQWTATQQFTTASSMKQQPEAYQQQAAELLVLPNPVRDRATIWLPQIDAASLINLHTVTGQCVRTQQCTAQQSVQLDVSDLQAGLYLVTVQTQHGRYQCKLVVVE